MNIKDLFFGIDFEQKGNEVDIKSIQTKASEEVVDGLFFCYKGAFFDGKEYVRQAIRSGAKVVVVENFLDIDICQIKVENVRKCISKVCGNFFKRPDKDLKIIGISGTNGKTTSSYIIKNILKCAGKKVGVIGTNAVYIGEVFYKATLTTPDPYELFSIFDKMKKAGVEYVVMEVSAHALDLYKVWGIEFEVGLFTNFTRDHLDYFGSMEKYKNAKQSFYNNNYCKKCIFNIDDSVGREFFDKCNVERMSYGLINPSDLFAINLKLSIEGSRFVVNVNDEVLMIETSMVGKFNVYNIMGAIGVCYMLNISADQIIAGAYTMPEVEGRFNLYKVEDKNVIIDFAHTPDGIENVLRTAKSLTKGDIVSVFGCGGNRDSGKRAEMGKIATKYSNKVFLTSDNPRFEDPYKIIEDIKVGAKDAIVIENRTEAIITAITTSAKGSTILVLGKGAEDYQEINGIKHPYSDKKVVQDFAISQKHKNKR